MRVRSVVLPVVSVCLLVSPLASQVTPWQAGDGRIVLNFSTDVLERSGLELIEVEETAETFGALQEGMETELLGFSTDGDSSLIALRERGGENFVPYGVVGGELRALGGFTLLSATTGQQVDFHGFRIFPADVRNDGPGGERDPDYFYLGTADGGLQLLLCYVKVYFADGETYVDPGADHDPPPTLRVRSWDIIVTPELGAELGRPDLVGKSLGEGKLEANAFPYDGPWQHPKGQNIFTPLAGGGVPEGGTGKDVKLGFINNVQHFGHVGTFPNGRTGLSFATTSCNVGSVNVPWLEADVILQEDHPGIAMQMYREMNGRFEQVAVSWMKHGFFALSNSQCTPCQVISNGTFLGVGCSDTYSAGTNANRTHLGPRDEWDPWAGTWECLGSYFDGTPVDCLRDEDGSGNGSVNHRLEAFDADLGLAGATYYYEAMYLVREDDDLHNNIGSREVTMSWNGFGWNFSTPGGGGNAIVEGPAIERWGELRTTTGLVPHDGNVILAVDTTQLAPNQWRYEYALFNWTMDRRPGSFSIPTCGPITDVYFHDIDDQPVNDWTVDTSGKSITFTYPGNPGTGHKRGGPLEFGTLYNFGFTALAAPATRDAVIGIEDPGPGGDLLGAETIGPDCFALSAVPPAPAAGTSTDIKIRGGHHGALLAVLAINGINLPSPIILTATPIPFVGGELVLPFPIGVDWGGFSFTMIAADFDTKVRGLTNLATVAIP